MKDLRLHGVMGKKAKYEEGDKIEFYKNVNTNNISSFIMNYAIDINMKLGNSNLSASKWYSILCPKFNAAIGYADEAGNDNYAIRGWFNINQKNKSAWYENLGNYNTYPPIISHDGRFVWASKYISSTDVRVYQIDVRNGSKSEIKLLGENLHYQKPFKVGNYLFLRNGASIARYSLTGVFQTKLILQNINIDNKWELNHTSYIYPMSETRMAIVDSCKYINKLSNYKGCIVTMDYSFNVIDSYVFDDNIYKYEPSHVVRYNDRIVTVYPHKSINGQNRVDIVQVSNDGNLSHKYKITSIDGTQSVSKPIGAGKILFSGGATLDNYVYRILNIYDGSVEIIKSYQNVNFQRHYDQFDLQYIDDGSIDNLSFIHFYHINYEGFYRFSQGYRGIQLL